MLVKKIQKKLKSNQGTSIFFGLLLFLVASILSAVMLSASVTAVKRVESDRKAEQNYLTCSSAAKLLRDAIESTEIEKVTTVTEYTKEEMARKEEVEWKVILKNTLNATARIADFLLDYVKTYNEANPADIIAENRTCKMLDEDKRMGDVTAECTISTGADGKGYTIIIKLKTGDGIDSCQMTVKLYGSENENVEIKNEEVKENKGDKKYTKIITTKTVTFRWEARDTIFGDKVRTSEAE